jgi:hypothetical protein
LYPFVFLGDGTLYVLSEDGVVREIDNNAESPVHEISSQQVYYIRSNSLFEYSISKNSRVKIAGDVSGFKLIHGVDSIVYTDLNNNVFYLNKKGNVNSVNHDMEKSGNLKKISALGNKYGVVFSGYNEEAQTADLVLLNLQTGMCNKILSDVNCLKSIYMSGDDSYIYFYRGEDLCVSDKKGNVKQQFENAFPVSAQNQTESEYNVNYGISYQTVLNTNYFLENISDNSNTADLVYSSKLNADKIDDGIYKVVYYSEDSQTIIYLKRNYVSKNLLYSSSKGGKPVLLAECSVDCRFLLSSNLLYILSPDETLSVLDITVKNPQIKRVAEGATDFYTFRNKDVVFYTDETRQYMLIDDEIEQLDPGDDVLFGMPDDKYLLCKTVSQTDMSQTDVSLDLVKKNTFIRITGSLDGNNVFYDKDLKNVLYLSKGEFFIWNDGNVKSLGNFNGIVPVSDFRRSN